jgi:hypothetical protein
MECRARTVCDPLETVQALSSLKSPGLDLELAVTKEHVALLLHNVLAVGGPLAVGPATNLIEGAGFREGVASEGRALFSRTENANHVWMLLSKEGKEARLGFSAAFAAKHALMRSSQGRGE